MKRFGVEVWTMRNGKIAIWEAAFNAAPAKQAVTIEQTVSSRCADGAPLERNQGRQPAYTAFSAFATRGHSQKYHFGQVSFGPFGTVYSPGLIHRPVPGSQEL
jgi:hypothetical protein